MVLQGDIMEYVQKDMKKFEGIYYPLKASPLERMLITKLPPEMLHPNPDDEFTHLDVGPSLQIINDYGAKIRERTFNGDTPFEERLIVEKMSPKGYMIINGHHRWAAAMRNGLKRVPVTIVNLTHEQDLRDAINKSHTNKRAALDLDEVVLCFKENEKKEIGSSTLRNLFYREPLRLGIPAIINELHKYDYDVWVYTRGFRSTDYINKLIKGYNSKFDGIINGMGNRPYSATEGDVMGMIEKKYVSSLHIELGSVLWVNSVSRDSKIFDIEDPDTNWSKKVIDIINDIEKNAPAN